VIEFVRVYIVDIMTGLYRIVFVLNWIDMVPENLFIGEHPISSCKIDGASYLQPFQSRVGHV
jgi:hypothetical protein